jgi:hypothetical protein
VIASLAARDESSRHDLHERNLGPDETVQRVLEDEIGSANGIRTRVTAVRGRCPRPLDDSAEELFVRIRNFRTKLVIFAWSTGWSKQLYSNFATSKATWREKSTRKIS